MDAVAVQCERRGLTNAATWLGELSLHALPCVLDAPLPHTSSLVSAVQELDKGVAQSQHYQRLHRVALGYFTKGEFQRCHHIILREVMRTTAEADASTSPHAAAMAGDSGSSRLRDIHHRSYIGGDDNNDVAASSSLPSPAVVRGFRTTALPPLLQFLSLYALFMDGIKAKQLSNNAGAGAGGAGGGGGPQRAVHPHARVLRAYLLEALRNPINAIPSATSSREADSPPHSPSATANVFYGQEKASSEGQTDLKPATQTEGWDPHTPSTKKQQPWTITSASRGPPAVQGTSAGQVADGTNGGSSAGSQAFSNFSPAPNARHPPGSPDAAATHVATAVVGSVHTTDLMHVDPYLTWLMGVVLRELRMRQECATFLLAAVSVNPLLRCAWEDLATLVSREAQLAELDAALEGLEPSFMFDIFAAEVRGLLGVTPVSSLRLRSCAAANAAATAAASKGEASVVGATLLSAASPHAVNGASELGAELPSPATARGGNTTLPPPPSPGSPSAALTSAAVWTNAWECLTALFPETPSLLSQLAHFYYHQRNRLDKAEAIYQRIRALDPHYYGILYDYSNVLYTKRDRLGLSSLVQAVYRDDAFRAETNFAVGNYYVLLGQHDRAALHFARTTAIDPQCAEAWLLLGHAYVEVKNTTAAVEAYRTAVELNERDYRGWYNLGQIYELLEAYHHALYYYWHTTSLRPADPGMWVAVANCLEHDGRVAESIACLERAETYDLNTSPSYPAYVRRIATHHIANSCFTRACVYLEKLVQSPAATGEDLLLALPFLIQHYVQRARKSMEVSARSASYDPALFSTGVSLSPATSPASVSAGRTALHHASAAAALQHLHKAEEHLKTMAELVMPVGETYTPATEVSPSQQQQQLQPAGDEGEGATTPMTGLENLTDDISASGRRRGKRCSQQASSYRAGRATSAAPAVDAEELPPVVFVRSRHREISTLRAQAMQLLRPSTPQQSGSSMPASSAAAAAAQSKGLSAAQATSRR